MNLPLTSMIKALLLVVLSISYPLWIVTATNSHQSDIDNIVISDVIGVEEKMLYPEFWISQIKNGETRLLTVDQINKNNKQLFEKSKPMTNLFEFPETMSAGEITEKISGISSIPSSKRFYADGRLVTKLNYQSYKKSLNISAIPVDQNIKFGIVVRRTNMRTFPTEERIYKTTTSSNLDRFQETALFPTQVVAILHESLDKKWYFGVSYNYAAWFKKVDIAIGNADEIFAYKKNKNFIVVTGSKIFTTYNSENKNVSEVQLEMGTVLPLVEHSEIPAIIAGQNTYTSHVISLPVRDNSGRLIFNAALIAKSTDVNIGFLPYTRNNIITQAFKFLGERYGWGHSYNARDCTGFVGEIFKTFGILMPRNSGQQGHSEQGKNHHFLKTASNTEKINYIKSLESGDLIYRPSHVMLLLGFHQGKPYIIHDVSGFDYLKSNGEYYQSILNGVSVTPLLPLQLTKNKSYIDMIYNVKKIQ